MRICESIGLGIPEFLLPRTGLDLGQWAVIACDQYTSEPEYWRKVRELVGDAPSTLKLVFPELYLQEKDREERIQRIKSCMRRYLDQGLFEEHEGLVYVERIIGDKTRKGLLACLDLERYDYGKGAKSLIRATEGTILERLPPRVRIREGAPLELPHIMVLIDDPQYTVIGPLTENKQQLIKLYDFELMQGSGHLTGYEVQSRDLEERVIKSLGALADPETFGRTYGLPANSPVLLYAMGDGNHSLATAKAVWEKAKQSAADRNAILNSDLRYALVEIVNLHDPALLFEPIHRVLFGLTPGRDPLKELTAFHEGRCRFLNLDSFPVLKQEVDSQKSATHKIGVITGNGFVLMEIERPAFTLAVGSLQNFLDHFLESRGAQAIDYVHGSDTLVRMGRQPGNLGFYLPAMDKRDLFKTVIVEGALPRKTFSMGEAREKRFYLEARKLTS
jgi:hypothetical protein